MKKKNYRLNTVVEVRRKGKEAASRKVLLRRAELDKEKLELKRRKLALENHRNDIDYAETRLSDELEQGVTASAVVSHRSYIEGLREMETEMTRALETQKESVLNAESDLESAIQTLTEASRELSVIEKHKEKWQTNEKKRVTKQEQKILDEISSILHERSKKL